MFDLNFEVDGQITPPLAPTQQWSPYWEYEYPVQSEGQAIGSA